MTFSNGRTLSKSLQYNGCYTQTGKPLLAAHPRYPYIKVCINNGDDLCTLAELKETDTVQIARAGQGMFADIQNARDIRCRDGRGQLSGDAVFADFRSVRGGDLKENARYARSLLSAFRRAPDPRLSLFFTCFGLPGKRFFALNKNTLQKIGQRPAERRRFSENPETKRRRLTRRLHRQHVFR